MRVKSLKIHVKGEISFQTVINAKKTGSSLRSTNYIRCVFITKGYT